MFRVFYLSDGKIASQVLNKVFPSLEEAAKFSIEYGSHLILEIKKYDSKTLHVQD